MSLGELGCIRFHLMKSIVRRGLVLPHFHVFLLQLVFLIPLVKVDCRPTVPKTPNQSKFALVRQKDYLLQSICCLQLGLHWRITYRYPQRRYTKEYCIYNIYQYLYCKVCLRSMLAIFLACVSEPPGELMVTNNACVGVYLLDFRALAIFQVLVGVKGTWFG